MDATKNFNGLDGEYGKNASLWLAYMEHRREKDSSPSTYLQHIDRHLEGEAAIWVKNTPDLRVLIYKGYMEVATESDIDVFYCALSDRFRLTGEEPVNLSGADLLSTMLRQNAGESLEQYTDRFRRTATILPGGDGNNEGLVALGPPMITTRIAQYTLGLSRPELRDSLCKQYIHHPAVDLSQAHDMAKAANRILDAENKVKSRKSRDAEMEQKRNENKKRKLSTRDEKSDSQNKESKKKKSKIVTLKLPSSRKEEGSSRRADQVAQATVGSNTATKPSQDSTKDV